MHARVTGWLELSVSDLEIPMSMDWIDRLNCVGFEINLGESIAQYIKMERSKKHRDMGKILAITSR